MISFEAMYSWVRDLPIIDWHNHLDMQMLAKDKPFGSLYEVWVKSDPYKHRAMRICAGMNIVPVDIDGDGDVDLVTTGKWGGPVIFENMTRSRQRKVKD